MNGYAEKAVLLSEVDEGKSKTDQIALQMT